MNKSIKPKKQVVIKRIVRTESLPVPKLRFVTQCETTESEPKKSPKAEKPAPKKIPNIDTPEPDVILGFAKKIDAVTNAKPKKITCIAFDEKATRKMNFPYDQAIYKDLIPLESSRKSCQVLTSRDPHPFKDREPNLADFISTRPVRKFVHQPEIKTDFNSSASSHLESLRLYKRISVHNCI